MSSIRTEKVLKFDKKELAYKNVNVSNKY